MNSLNKILPIVAVVAAVGAAIVPAHKSGAQGATQYYWFDANTNAYQGLRTKAQEMSVTGCDGDGDICAKAYTSGQLNNSSNPSAGHQDVPQADDVKEQ